MSAPDIEHMLRQAPNIKIAVVGDLIIDEYREGVVKRISPEAPVMILQQTNVSITMGGAGNVYNNLKALGANVVLYCNSMERIWGPKDAVYANPYPCSRKIRMVSGQHQLFRVDVEQPFNQIEWSEYRDLSWWREFMDNFEWYDLIVISDYSKGLLSDGVINTIIDFARQTRKTIIVDAKRDRNRYLSRNVIFKCNASEWEPSSESIEEFKGIVVTNGSQGLRVVSEKEAKWIKGIPVGVVDVCGAGDTVTAVLALATAAGLSIFAAANLANIAGAEVCRHPGVVAITPEQLAARAHDTTY